MISIDQNCHSLWDVLPKLQALARRGQQVTHYIEDVDVAFTSLGTHVDGIEMRLARERFHRSGGQDWGAALFYSEFLGRLPVEIRDWEPITGEKIKALAKELACSVDDLYDEYSPGDNWQLIGASFVGDRQHHRVVGDLSVVETATFLREILDTARRDMLRAFPAAPCRQRVTAWCDAEQQRLERLIGQCGDGRLVELYHHWLSEYLGDSVQLAATSSLFGLHNGPESFRLLEMFAANYGRAAALYNEAVEETAVGLRGLHTGAGELPFFATLIHEGHLVRTPMRMDGQAVRIGADSFTLSADGRLPLDAMAEAGVQCLAGKALLLVIQARWGPNARALVMPYQGSLYMPAAYRLAATLAQAGLLNGPVKPVVRVRFHLLDHIASLDTVVRLPPHLVGYFGREEIPCRQLAASWVDLAAEAAARLADFRDSDRREKWQTRTFPDLTAEIAELHTQQRTLARTDPKSAAIRELWKHIKSHKTEILRRTVRQIACDYQASRIDYWDSRGALLPWAVALGGESFYDELIAKADVYEETP